MSTYLNGKRVAQRHGHTSEVDGAVLNQPGPLVYPTPAWAGTVSVAAGTPDVVGEGTYFTFLLGVGAWIKIAGESFVIIAITDATHLTLSSNHVAGASAVAYYTEGNNVLLGSGAQQNHTGAGSVAVGHLAMRDASGDDSCAFGERVLQFDAALNNCGFGSQSLAKTTTGEANVAMGQASMGLNETGRWNTAIGTQAMYTNVSGQKNVAIGPEALYNNVSGDLNVCLGHEAGRDELGSNKLYIANAQENEGVLIYGDFIARLLGLGTVSPTAVLHLKGVLTDALTGTVSVTINTAAVVGVGTAFDTELVVGDAIKIVDEIFTVQVITDATHLTLDSNHAAGASGVTAYRDPDLYRIQNGDGVDRLVIDKSGYAYLTPVWNDLRVPLTSGALGVGNPPTFAQFMDNGSGSVGAFAYSFAYQAVAGNEEQLFFSVQVPHDYKEGTDIQAHLHWSPAVSGTAGQFAKWGVEYTWINIDGTFGVTTIATSDASSAATATTSGDGTLAADKHYTTEIAAITGTGKLISSMLVCRLFRNSSHADDTLAQAAFGLEFDFHYQSDTMGSRQELVK